MQSYNDFKRSNSDASLMNIGILGAGPAGLYAATLIKRSRPGLTVEIIEQNPRDSTWGFGVVFSDRALTFLRKDDPETADLIEPHMETWSEIQVTHLNETVAIDGVGFSSIGRLQLLQLLQKRAAEYDVKPVYNQRVNHLKVFEDCDFIIGADGVNSLVRSDSAQQFDENISIIPNWYCWYGANRSFNCLTQTFKQTEYGHFNAHHYRYAPGMSTFIVECDEKTFENAGFSEMSEPQYRKICEFIFREALEGAELIDNNSIWRRFPVLSNRNWYSGNRILIGDALHTAHYSIGSGTRLAMEDAIALVKALTETSFDITEAFPKFQVERQATLKKIIDAALSSARWYERFADHMTLSPWEFALSYMMRSGRMSAEKLRTVSPQFASGLETRGIHFE